MRKFLILFSLSLVIISCATSKNSISKSNNSDAIATKVVSNAYKYKGVKYKYGGVTKKGMDCSGLIYTSFLQENIQLPRVSYDMAKKGRKIPLNRSKKGDLLFFKTSKSARKINHVGLVVSNTKGEVYFIHSTTSKGVIISSLNESYWRNAFVKAIKVL